MLSRLSLNNKIKTVVRGRSGKTVFVSATECRLFQLRAKARVPANVSSDTSLMTIYRTFGRHTYTHGTNSPTHAQM